MNINHIKIDHLLGPDLVTYDPYDLWKTKLGLWLKKCYYQNGAIAIPLIAPFFLLDHYAPKLVRKFIDPQEYPTVRAMAAMAAINLYEITSNSEYIELADKSIDWLIKNKSPGYHGACWGLNFHWMAKGGYSSPTTPFITHTPYCVEALLKFHDVTHDVNALEVAASSLDFLESDMNILFEDSDKLALGYGPGYQDRIVINANSYSMMLYALLSTRIAEKKDYLLQKAGRIYNYVISSQQEDGSWLYYNDNEKGNFIDCFHSCFILKNIIKYGRITDTDVMPIVNKGLQFLLENHLDKKTYLAKRFTVAANPSLVKYDLYDQAELMNVLLLAKRNKYADRLYESIIKYFYIHSKQNFGYQIDIFGLLNKMTYLRWPVMPMVYVLSEYYKLNKSFNSTSGLSEELPCVE